MADQAIQSYAKINMGLLLLEKRTDGYHDIATIFQQIDLHDSIFLEEKTQSGIVITCNDLNVPLDSNNFVHQALALCMDTLDIQSGMTVHVEKSIPVGSGLGGGSSNAAAVLTAANHLWGQPFSESDLLDLAIQIGSDVPFFLRGGTMLGTGRGEILKRVSIPADYWIVLLLPSLSVSTAWAYHQAKITLTKDEKLSTFNALFEAYNPRLFKKMLKNDLESVVFQRHPELAISKDQLYERGAFYASMSGSGSAVYGLFHDLSTAEQAAAFFSKDKKMLVRLCRPVVEPSELDSS